MKLNNIMHYITESNTKDIETIAKVCHETNRAFCEANDDKTQKPWEQCEDWQRDSTIQGIKHILNNPNAGQSDSHDTWCKSLTDKGWVYGEVKDQEKKTHPSLVSYDKLPLVQQIKDKLFVNVVKSFM